MSETTTQESLHEPSPEAREALAREQDELRGEVVLWQRWARAIAVVMLAAAALVANRDGDAARYVPVAAIAIAYIACVFSAGLAIQRGGQVSAGIGWSVLLVSADVFAIAGIIYFTTPPQLEHRFLLLALFCSQLAAFYFGWALGAYAIVLAILVDLGLAFGLRQTIPGVRAESPLDLAVFAIAAGVLTYIFGSFRERLNRLRLFCKVIEEGDLSTSVDVSSGKYPDEVTLLARSFDAMRTGLAEQIGTDPLTGCMNRRALEARLKSDWRLAKRRGTHIALAAIDLDHFKQINDSRGHPVGDIVLQQLAGIMKATARDTDAVARFGGDEFVILLPDTAWQGALTFAERLRRRVDDFTFGPPGSPMAITISVGVALARGTDPLSPEELLKEADRSLYKAKQQGRNRVFA
jgi:diguanylate cyclase (GGDEF)-like protein